LRAWRKTVIHRARPRPDHLDGREERFGWCYALMAPSLGGWSRDLAVRLEAVAGGRVFRPRGDADARGLLDTLTSRASRAIG